MDKYQDRVEAGQVLATQLQEYANQKDVLILALPRGGVPVAFEIAKALSIPLDILLVRKLGMPGNEEFAFGAIASGGACFIHHDILHQLHLTETRIHAVIEKEKQELLRRELAYRQNRPFPQLKGKTILLVDDGIATGATMRVAVEALKSQHPTKIVIVTPVMPVSTYDEFVGLGYEVVCPMRPSHFLSVGSWYEHFPQTSDEEVCRLLAAT